MWLIRAYPLVAHAAPSVNPATRQVPPERVRWTFTLCGVSGFAVAGGEADFFDLQHVPGIWSRSPQPEAQLALVTMV